MTIHGGVPVPGSRLRRDRRRAREPLPVLLGRDPGDPEFSKLVGLLAEEGEVAIRNGLGRNKKRVGYWPEVVDAE